MEKLLITGGKELFGEIKISGAKNAAVAIIPAALLVDGVCTIENVPKIKDVDVIISILDYLGAKVSYIDENTITIDSRSVSSYMADCDSVRAMRASYYLIGALLGRFKNAHVRMPGGCSFCDRPIDQHIKGFELLGATVTVDENDVVCACADQLIGTSVFLDVVSVGSTINVMLAACCAKGTTVIENAAREPHIVDVANFLNIMGAKIKGAGTSTIRITGVSKLHGGTYRIIPDQIEAGTFMIAAAGTGGDVVVSNIIPKHMESLTVKLAEAGVQVTELENAIRIQRTRPTRKINVTTMPYPGFPTDLQPQMVTLLSTADGTSIVTEGVWQSRFQYISELTRMGANIVVADNRAIIHGVSSLSGAGVSATDLRAGASLVIAGLMADGVTEIYDLKHIDRGYENLEEKLRSIGADIKRITE